MPWNKQTGRASASGCLSRRPRLPFAWGNDDLPFLKPVKSAMLAAKPRVSGEFRLTEWEQIDRRIGSLDYVVGRENRPDNLAWCCYWCNTWPQERRLQATDHGRFYPE